MANQSDNNYMSVSQGEAKPGPFLAKVISHLDPTNMGILEVEILRAGAGNTASEGQLHQVQYMSPFYGVTGEAYTSPDPDDYNNTQKSYGMWMIPPDPGSTVVVIFIDGDPKRGYWIGCVMDKGMNFMLPGLAATENVVETQMGRVPVAEYNKKITENTVDATKVKKPKHPLADILSSQGLITDDIRGITTSSARREAPSMVFGISTPGPIDKRSNAKRGPIGKKEHQVPNAFVSRLGGSTFVMDDGDDKFLRKKSAHEAGPEYVAVEQGETGGDVTIPHNELVRLRTRTGHQILMHNSEDLIYISNAGGTTWIELTSNGKIDIYAQDSISIHTNKDFNFHANRDINLEAGRNINVKSANNIHIDSGKNTSLIVGLNGKITTKGKLDVNTTGSNKFTAGTTTEFNSGGNHIMTAAKIHSNGIQAAVAEMTSQLLTHILPLEDGSTIETIMRRVPTHEPYPQHENLDPIKYSSANTDRNVDNDRTTPTESMKEPANMWQKYTTATDTFAKVKGAE